MSASEYEEDTSTTESPFIKTRPMLKQQQSSDEYDSEDDDQGRNDNGDAQSDGEDQQEEEEEEDDDQYEEEKEEQNGTENQVKVATKIVKPIHGPPRANAPKLTAAATTQHPTYDKMVFEAVKDLDENKRSGTSISKILKFVTTKYDLEDNRARLFCKKAIEKGIKDETYVKTSGVGFSGSITFSSKYRQKWNKEKKKALKPPKQSKTSAEPKPKTTSAKTKKQPPTATKKVPTSKAKPKPKAKSGKSSKDSNNNATSKAVPKKHKPGPNTKAKVSKTTGSVRLSINPKVAPPKARIAASKVNEAKSKASSKPKSSKSKVSKPKKQITVVKK
ncbi:histone H1B-like [Malaya genurostris]|uniref:histone H1B-like n=1 Tax=Malaya genurostris TaxID=325434 RepID=UPI0026F3FAC0|nr:histone H1B-like [Malaya genurostris]XP_058447202.1 histone H1B-like [Malaya genurostris]